MDWIREILRGHGQQVTIRLSDGSAVTQAFLQPVTQRDEQVPEVQSELGGIDGRVWLDLGKSAVAKNDRICWQDKEFRVRSSRPYYIGEKLMYWWAALEQAKEAAQ